jgi:hypothetical protein
MVGAASAAGRAACLSYEVFFLALVSEEEEDSSTSLSAASRETGARGTFRGEQAVTVGRATEARMAGMNRLTGPVRQCYRFDPFPSGEVSSVFE